MFKTHSKMTKRQFQIFWTKNYPNSLPINYLFKLNFAERWLRIHNLPNSKRYADTDEEWAILYHRHNTIFDELLPKNCPIDVVINYIKEDNPLFKQYNFKNIGAFVDKENETVFQSFSFKTIWNTNVLNDLLKQIANDEIRAFIIAEGHIVSPYDGGIDLIFSHDFPTEKFKKKYEKWLSKRADGL